MKLFRYFIRRGYVMRFKVKKFSIITALVLALSLCLSGISFAASGQSGSTHFINAYCVYESETVMLNNGRTTHVSTMPSVSVSEPLPSDFYGNVWFVYESGADAAAGTWLSITFDIYFSQGGQEPVLLEGNDKTTFQGEDYYIGTCVGGDVGTSIHLLDDISSWAYAFDTYSVAPYVNENGSSGARCTASVYLEYSTPLNIQYGFYSPSGGSCYTALHSVRLRDSSGQVVEVVKDGVQQIVSGWNDNSLNNSNQELGGALGELDNMQASADSDLHDAIADMTQPDLDEQSTGISFMTSSISMLWGALGGFQAVILCALALVVFNFISRYRGS